MDPHANIGTQVEIARELLATTEGMEAGSPFLSPFVEEAERLAEHVIALDEWRRKGGFDPYADPTP